MPDYERIQRKLLLHTCCSEFERMQMEEHFKTLDRGRWQGVAVCCAVFIPAIMALSYALVNY